MFRLHWRNSSTVSSLKSGFVRFEVPMIVMNACGGNVVDADLCKRVTWVVGGEDGARGERGGR